MNTTKKYILERAFSLFLEKGYKGVSIENIQEKTELSKGAIYYYFKSKEEVFSEAMELFFFPTLKVFRYTESDSSTPLKDAIEIVIKERDCQIQKLREITSFKVDDFHFFKLAFQVEEFYPDFKTRVATIFSEEGKEWEKVIRSAIEQKEVHETIDVHLTATLFIIIPRGLGLSMAFSSGISIETLRETYEKFYFTLKA
ncbi:TetR/AcrR family transcriptional regulator [Porphyromonas circumdentaria]|uniref:TetR/AcrR family transcriptional regulator n=1 Tax=Porphyromonas circumdentaria TaxID=29524 RepID=UPI0026DD8FB5|nr:TetR/AcrR family transcriptional regulator [Porphyromonas circumdentaria]MDO4721764.1 TetR/AcrR family transcriptional regulator [Porphyromonas circumdentaria]